MKINRTLALMNVNVREDREKTSSHFGFTSKVLPKAQRLTYWDVGRVCIRVNL